MLGGRFDVVGFDPRGVASSDPIQCFDTNEIENAFVAACWTFPYRWDQMRPYFACSTAAADVCLARGQHITPHMSTADVVRGLDLLRQAVGDERLTYLGFSYGSYIGNTYANLFPNKVRALVIDGVLDPRLWSSGWDIVSHRVATAEEFNEFLRLCDEAGDACALNAPGGSAARFNALASALLNEPLVFENGFVYSYDWLVVDANNALYTPSTGVAPTGTMRRESRCSTSHSSRVTTSLGPRRRTSRRSWVLRGGGVKADAAVLPPAVEGVGDGGARRPCAPARHGRRNTTSPHGCFPPRRPPGTRRGCPAALSACRSLHPREAGTDWAAAAGRSPPFSRERCAPPLLPAAARVHELPACTATRTLRSRLASRPRSRS
jgi:pimeloyl-ACP methyl ester carboxylesterase